jgi:hypothetical protein
MADRHLAILQSSVTIVANDTMTFGMVLTSYGLLKRHFQLGEVVAFLRAINRAAALRWVMTNGRGNHFHTAKHLTWQATPETYQQLLDEVVPAPHHARAWQVFKEPGFISPFSEVSLVALIGLACRYCPDSGGDALDTIEGRWRLFQALLALQDSLMPHDLIDAAARAHGHEVKPFLITLFPYAMRTILANISQQNRWSYDLGRLHALIHVREVGACLSDRRRGMTVAEWFQRRVGVPAVDYEVIANVQFGAAVYGADFGALREQQPKLAPAIERLILLSATTPEELVAQQPEPKTIFDANNHADWLLRRPLLTVGGRNLVTSVGNLFNKFHRGLPYLAIEARGASDTENTDARAEFGDIFQGYILWLFNQWFAGTSVEVISEYWTAGCGLLLKEGEPFEKDVLLVADEVAYPFEIKASVPTLKVRRGGGIADYCAAYKPVTVQAYQAAQALIQGKAFYDKAMTKPIRPVRRAYPCGIGFEFNALCLPYSDFVQTALEFDLKCSVFRQFPSQLPELFASIRARAKDVLRRFSRLLPNSDYREDYDTRPGLVRRLTEHAEAASTVRLKELTAAP